MIAFLCYLITALVYTAILLWGVFGDHTNDALGYGYGLFSFYFIIPVISFLGALIIGISKKTLKVWKWIYPILFSAFAFVISIIVYDEINSQIPFTVYILPSIIGFALGLYVNYGEKIYERNNGKNLK